MKSSLNQEAFSRWLAVASTEEKNKMVAAGALYGSWMKKNDDEKMVTAYTLLQKQVVQAEESYGIKFIVSPDGDCYRAFLVLSDWANKILLQLEKKRNQLYKECFQNVKEANEWLRINKVDVVSMGLETGTGFGFFANHTTIKKIFLTYKKNEKTKYFYSILEEEELGFFIKKEQAKIAEKWKEKHPELEIISQKYSSNARGDMASLAIGFGNYAENVKVVTLCRGLKE